MGRAAQGVKILSIDKPDFVIGVDRIVQEDAVYVRQDAAPVPGEAGTVEAEPAAGEGGETTPDPEQGELF
jgi:DNA gyrase subunit A